MVLEGLPLDQEQVPFGRLHPTVELQGDEPVGPAMTDRARSMASSNSAAVPGRMVMTACSRTMARTYWPAPPEYQGNRGVQDCAGPVAPKSLE